MKTKIENLKDLFVEQGRELYSALHQEQKELPEMQRQVNNPKLKSLIDRQVTLAKKQSQTIQEAFKSIHESPEGERNECCEAVFKKSKDLIGRSKNQEVRDSVIINSIQRLNHSKITGLGSLSAYAREIDQKKVAEHLHESLNHEKKIDQELSVLAETDINKKAMSALAH